MEVTPETSLEKEYFGSGIGLICSTGTGTGEFGTIKNERMHVCTNTFKDLSLENDVERLKEGYVLITRLMYRLSRIGVPTVRK